MTTYNYLTKQDVVTLMRLLETDSPSSYEDEIFGFLQKYIDGRCTMKRDCIGNVYLTHMNSGMPPLLMLTAHIDEIGLQVVRISEDGYVRFRTFGGVDLSVIPGSQVSILTSKGKVPGVICKVPIHIEMKERNDKRLQVEDMWIDIGCVDYNEASSVVSIGDMISFYTPAIRLHNGRISGKSLDDKLGVFIIAKVMKLLSYQDMDCPICAVFTVQEEVGGKGAVIAAERVNPRIGICVDVGVATDCPGINRNKYGELNIGAGPALVYNSDTNRTLTNLSAAILDKAERIAYQKSVGLSAAGGTDTNKIQIAKEGIPCLLLSIPLRSMHTTSEVCDLYDVDMSISSLLEIIRNYNSLIDSVR